MAKNYSYPRVTMSTLAKKHSHNVVNVPDTTIMFAPLVTEKGPDDRIIKIHTLSEFIEIFGSFNEEFYELNGQMALNVYNWLSNGGTLMVKRIASGGHATCEISSSSNKSANLDLVFYNGTTSFVSNDYLLIDLPGSSDKLVLNKKEITILEAQDQDIVGDEEIHYYGYIPDNMYIATDVIGGLDFSIEDIRKNFGFIAVDNNFGYALVPSNYYTREEIAGPDGVSFYNKKVMDSTLI